MATPRDRQRAQSHRIAQQTHLAAQPASGGLAAQAIAAGEALLSKTVQSVAPSANGHDTSRQINGQAPLPAWLPQSSCDVLSRLAKRVDDRRRVTQTLSIDVEGAFAPTGVTPGLRQRVLEARQEVSRLTDPQFIHRGGGGFVYPESHDSVVQARKNLATLESELASANARMLPDEEAQLLIRTSQWLAASAPRESAEPVAVSRTDSVESLRAERADLLVKLDEVDDAPQHSSTVKERISAEIRTLARKGEPSIGSRGILWVPRNETTPITVVGVAGSDSIQAQGFSTDRSPDVLSLLCALFSDEIESLLLGKISTANDASALTEQQRRASIAKIEQDILLNERRECLKIEEGSNVVPYRADCDVRALLSLA